MQTYELATTLQVYNNEENVAITVTDRTEFGEGYININTDDQVSKQYYGPIDLTLDKEQALLLARSIIKLIEG